MDISPNVRPKASKGPLVVVGFVLVIATVIAVAMSHDADVTPLSQVSAQASARTPAPPESANSAPPQVSALPGQPAPETLPATTSQPQQALDVRDVVGASPTIPPAELTWYREVDKPLRCSLRVLVEARVLGVDHNGPWYVAWSDLQADGKVLSMTCVEWTTRFLRSSVEGAYDEQLTFSVAEMQIVRVEIGAVGFDFLQPDRWVEQREPDDYDETAPRLGEVRCYDVKDQKGWDLQSVPLLGNWVRGQVVAMKGAQPEVRLLAAARSSLGRLVGSTVTFTWKDGRIIRASYPSDFAEIDKRLAERLGGRFDPRLHPTGVPAVGVPWSLDPQRLAELMLPGESVTKEAARGDFLLVRRPDLTDGTMVVTGRGLGRISSTQRDAELRLPEDGLSARIERINGQAHLKSLDVRGESTYTRGSSTAQGVSLNAKGVVTMGYKAWWDR